MSAKSSKPLVLVLDNYDSFTFNLVQYLGELGAHIEVRRNDEISVAGIRRLSPDGLLVSPGPGTPDDAGISLKAIKAFAGKIPLLGVCLGHQALAQAFGGTIGPARHILHGKTSRVLHGERGIFAGLKNPFTATRYHSLEVPRSGLPCEFEVVAWTADDEIMAIKHKQSESWGVQFHPESILTEDGIRILRNWLESCR